MDYFASLFDAPAATQPAKVPPDGADTFGCCSRYRACSDAGRCIIADQSYYANCSYRKNLEAGRIFYGKRADGFSAAEYKEIQDRVNDLPSAARSALDALLVEFCEYSRGVQRCIVRNDQLDVLSGVGLFDFLPLGSAFPSLCGYRELKAYASLNGRFVSEFAAACTQRDLERRPYLLAKEQAKAEGNTKEVDRLDVFLKKELPGSDTADFLCRWLNTSATGLRDELAAPYRFAQPVSGASRYIEELYRDTLLSSYDSRVYALSPLAEDGLLISSKAEAEKKRRKALSRGCVE